MTKEIYYYGLPRMPCTHRTARHVRAIEDVDISWGPEGEGSTRTCLLMPSRERERAQSGGLAYVRCY